MHGIYGIKMCFIVCSHFCVLLNEAVSCQNASKVDNRNVNVNCVKTVRRKSDILGGNHDLYPFVPVTRHY